jgi:hypothetical protein
MALRRKDLLLDTLSNSRFPAQENQLVGLWRGSRLREE